MSGQATPTKARSMNHRLSVVAQPLHGCPEGRNIARQVDHGAVHHLHRRRLEPDDVTGRLHGLGEGGKPADAEDRMGRDRL